jgi:hypothetical protein
MATTTPLADAEAEADRLVADLRQGPLAEGEILRRLAATARPYFAWAAAWSTLQGRLAGDPDDDRNRRALAELRAVEPTASALDRRPGATAGTGPDSAEVARARGRARRQRGQAVGDEVHDALVPLENAPDQQRRRRARHPPVAAPQAR